VSAHILIVDDSDVVQQAASKALSFPDKHSVSTARTPVGALAEARRRRPDLILIDLSLGGMGGLALCEALAQDAVLREVPVVVMTPSQDPLAESLKGLISPHALLTKPFSHDALRRIVRENLDEVRLSKQAVDDHRQELESWANDIGEAPRDSRAERLEACLAHYGLGPNVAMSGDLAVIGLAELFQMLTMQGQNGLLQVDTGTLALEIFFWEGKIDFVHALQALPALLLGRVLIAEGVLQQKELELFLRYRRPDRLLGQQLVQLGYVSVDELREALARQSSELVFELLRQRAGRFAFRRATDAPPFAHEFRLGLSTDGLLMEGYRRVDELQLIEEKLGNRQVVPVLDRHAIERFGHQNLTPQEQHVLALCDGERSIAQIVDRAPFGGFDTLKGLYRLSESRLIQTRAANTD